MLAITTIMLCTKGRVGETTIQGTQNGEGYLFYNMALSLWQNSTFAYKISLIYNVYSLWSLKWFIGILSLYNVRVTQNKITIIKSRKLINFLFDWFWYFLHFYRKLLISSIYSLNFTVWCNQIGIVLAVLSSWITLAWHPEIKTAFNTKCIKINENTNFHKINN